jgi:hypothetical protein
MHHIIGFDFKRFNDEFEKSKDKSEFIKKINNMLNMQNFFAVQRRWEKLHNKKLDAIDFMELLVRTQVEGRLFLDLLMRCKGEKILF